MFLILRIVIAFMLLGVSFYLLGNVIEDLSKRKDSVLKKGETGIYAFTLVLVLGIISLISSSIIFALTFIELTK